jgi:ABC-type bacteriocin/lantibiotic exporter with double-glycine peptidase domain
METCIPALALPLDESDTRPPSSAENSHTLQDNCREIQLQSLRREHPATSERDVISDASFGWNPNDQPTLRGISIAIRKCQFTFIIGGVGSGKSTLMKAMLGETLLLSGFIRSSTHNAAYVGQDPWIQNLTIRENIVRMSGYNQDWYNKVLHCYGLSGDFLGLRNKDATKAGTAGLSLSGGKKKTVCPGTSCIFAGDDGVS